MRREFTLEYWRNGDWYVGRLVAVPGGFSQGKTVEELDESIQDAYGLMVTEDRQPAPSSAQRRPVELEDTTSRRGLRGAMWCRERDSRRGDPPGDDRRHERD